MKITWKQNRLGIDLNPTWEVQSARLHTVPNMQQPDGTQRDTIVLYLSVTDAQYRKLTDEYGKANIPAGMLGLNVIPLFPNAVLWKFILPGYRTSEEYMALEISET